MKVTPNCLLTVPDVTHLLRSDPCKIFTVHSFSLGIVGKKPNLQRGFGGLFVCSCRLGWMSRENAKQGREEDAQKRDECLSQAPRKKIMTTVG